MLQSLGFGRRAIVLSFVQESVLAAAAGALIGSGLCLWLLDGLAIRFSMGVFGLIFDGPVVVIGLVVGVVPFLLGLVFFLDPLFRKRKNEDDGSDSSEGGVVKDRDGFLKLTVTREGLPDDGTPQMVTIQDDLVDAWNKFRNVPIGTIWLRKMEGTVMAFNTICPHLGCTVEFRGAEQDFYCPCHLSAFNLDGKKKNPIPPRGMDSLELKPDTGDEIWVRFMNFRGGFSEKLEI